MSEKYRVLHSLINDHLPDNGWLSKEEFDGWLNAFAGVAQYIAVGPEDACAREPLRMALGDDL